jgi:invasion protein IalB
MPAPAQEAAPAAAPAVAQPGGDKPLVQAFDDWEVRCFAIKSASPCDMLFAEVRKGTEKRVTSVSIAFVPSRNEYVMQVAVPFGVALADGLVMTAGNYKSARMIFRRCDTSGCFVETAVGDDLINALKSGGDGAINVVADGGKPVAFGLPLKGFAGAQLAMVNLATQKATAPQPATAAANAAPVAR